jgi:dihydroorotate dehydrogenase
MPDWFYRTVSRSVLFRLPPALSRNLALGVMGALGRWRLGRFVIDFLGHMRPDLRLQRTFLDTVFSSPVGIGCAVDGNGIATQALARFGVGFLEVGPITVAPYTADKPVERRVAQQSLWIPNSPGNEGVQAWTAKLARIASAGVPLFARLAVQPGTSPQQATDDCRKMIVCLGPWCAGFTLALPSDWTPQQQREHLQYVVAAITEANVTGILVLCLAANEAFETADGVVECLLNLPRTGVLVEAATREGDGQLLGLPAREDALQLVRHLRQRWGDNLVLIGGGVHEPEDALHLVETGANLVLIDAGLVYSGPGLPKRVNDVLLCRRLESAPKVTTTALPAPVTQMAWFWTLLLGISMFVGGIMAMAIAVTRVVLPYDEAFVGLSRGQLEQANPRLLSFLTHDRVSLAGTMIAVGVLYLQLSLHAVRRGQAWARLTILCSAFAGFGSFFLFLGFGYLEPFHAFVTAVLFQFLLFALYAKLGTPVFATSPNLREDWRWRTNQWGQFLFVLHGLTLVAAGLTISFIGVTHVFVHEDLEFMQTTADKLAKASPRLLPMIAHDRASFGGMLIATGITVLLPALWGFRQGDAWLWWALLGGGGTAYAAAIGVHLAVGYLNLWHLLPALGGTALLAVGLALSYPYLCGRPQERTPRE